MPTYEQRQAFTYKMRKVKAGMDVRQVRHILGKPSRVVRFHAKEGEATAWFYCGARGADAFPSLGTVGFGTVRKVTQIIGADFPRDDRPTLTPEELERALYLIWRAPGMVGDEFDPMDLVEAVNYCLALGKDKTIAACAEYNRLIPAMGECPADGTTLLRKAGAYALDHRVSCVLLALFPGQVHLGGLHMYDREPGPNPANPWEQPIGIVDDLPLCVSGYVDVTRPDWTPDWWHQIHVQVEGVMRRAPMKPVLNPDAGDKLLDAMPGFEKGPLERRLALRRMLRKQVLRAMEHVRRDESRR